MSKLEQAPGAQMVEYSVATVGDEAGICWLRLRITGFDDKFVGPFEDRDQADQAAEQFLENMRRNGAIDLPPMGKRH